MLQRELPLAYMSKMLLPREGCLALPDMWPRGSTSPRGLCCLELVFSGHALMIPDRVCSPSQKPQRCLFVLLPALWQHPSTCQYLGILRASGPRHSSAASGARELSRPSQQVALVVLLSSPGRACFAGGHVPRRKDHFSLLCNLPPETTRHHHD